MLGGAFGERRCLLRAQHGVERVDLEVLGVPGHRRARSRRDALPWGGGRRACGWEMRRSALLVFLRWTTGIGGGLVVTDGRRIGRSWWLSVVHWGNPRWRAGRTALSARAE